MHTFDFMSKNNNAAQPLHPKPLLYRVLTGALIGLVLIALFLLSVKADNPAWPKYWKLRPLLIVPIAGGMGGVFYYLMDHFRARGGWIKIVATIISLLGFIIALWMGTILGLDGTLWD
jgi:hypothetical protein